VWVGFTRKLAKPPVLFPFFQRLKHAHSAPPLPLAPMFIDIPTFTLAERCTKTHPHLTPYLAKPYLTLLPCVTLQLRMYSMSLCILLQLLADAKSANSFADCVEHV
jgi:hypothetical protein